MFPRTGRTTDPEPQPEDGPEYDANHRYWAARQPWYSGPMVPDPAYYRFDYPACLHEYVMFYERPWRRLFRRLAVRQCLLCHRQEELR